MNTFTTKSSMRALVAAMLMCGCGSLSITRPARTAISAVPDLATIIVVNPEMETTRYPANLLNDRGELIGQVMQRTYTAVRVPPGPVRLYAVFRNVGGRIEGYVAPGRVYFATVSVFMGYARNGVAIRALTPRSADWPRRDELLSTSTHVEMDPAQHALGVQRVGDTTQLRAALDRQIDGFVPTDREALTLRPEDGL